MGTLSTGLSKYSRIAGFMPNLFEVSLFGSATDATAESLDIPFGETGQTVVTSQVIKYYCSAYELPAPAITAERNKLNKKTYIKKYASPESVSITWQENNNLDVWKYHQDWLRRFYNRETDMFVTSSAGKKRNADIRVQRYPDAGKSVFDPYRDFDLQTSYTIRLYGLIPQAIPPFRGDWSQDAGNSTGLIIKYFVDYITILQGTDINSESITAAQ